MKRLNPIQHFLGLRHRVVSPYELLGVEPASCDEIAVRAALERRLARLRSHPESISHEADEVRLALHAAAAQLTDPAVLQHLSQQKKESPGGTSAPAPAVSSAFCELASSVLARSGGWNRQSQHWLSLLASAHGLNNAQLQSELRAIVNRQRPARREAQREAQRAGRPTQQSSESSAPVPQPTQTRHRSRTRSRLRRRRRAKNVAALWSAIALGALAVVAIIMMAHARIGSGSTDQHDSSTSPIVKTPLEKALSPKRPPALAPTPGRVASAAPALATPETIVRWLETAHGELAQDPGDASWRFERAVEAFSISWLGFSAADRVKANELINSFLRRSDARSPSGVRAMAAVVRGAADLASPGASVSPEQVKAAVWSLATLGALATDPNADRSIRNAASSAWSGVSAGDAPTGRTFARAAEEALPIVADRMTAQMAPGRPGVAVGAWLAWIQSVDRITGALDGADESHRRADRLTLRAVESLLRSGAHVSTNAQADAALEALLPTVRWAPDLTGQPPPAWGALLAWLDELTVPTADVAVVTEWVASRSRAPGVGPQMTLSRGSIPESRASLRERYARVWKAKGDSDSKGFAAVWSRALGETLGSIKGKSLVASLARTALSARFNAAAALQWGRQTDRASRILMDPASPINAAVDVGARAAGVVRRAGRDFDGQWALRYLGVNGQDRTMRMRLLSDLARTSRALGPIDADVLAEAALRNPITELRSRAQQVVRLRGAEPGVISALLDTIGKAPQTASTSALITAVTGIHLPISTEKSWPIAARLALVDRLLDLLAPQDELALADRLSRVINRAYADRNGVGAHAADVDEFGEEAASESNDAEGPIADDPASALWTIWKEQARKLAPNPHAPVRYADLVRRRRGRLRLASGPMGRFAAEQLSVVQAMAFVISAERPSRANLIADLMAGLTSDRRSAGSIVGQMFVTERAMNQLWAIRFGAGGAKASKGSNTNVGAPAGSVSGAPALDVSSLDSDWLASIPIAHLRDRLLALAPDRPRAYFDLAEEVASESPTPKGRALARTLFTLAFSYDRASPAPTGLAPSVFLALAQSSTRRDEKRWLLTMALSLDPSLVEVVTQPKGPQAAPKVRLDLARGLELYRLGEYRLALKRLDQPPGRALLMEYSAMLTGGANAIYAELATEPTCRECRNRRITPAPDDPGADFRLCRTCDGDPGPDLSDAMLLEELRLERAILSDQPRSWSASLVLTRGKPMRDVNPAELLRR